MKINGCGACSGIMRHIPVPHGRFFREECNLHDVRYNIGGGKKERQVADAELFEGMVNHSISYFGGRNMVGSQYWFICLAYLYYLAVRIFGGQHFNFKG